MKKLFIISLSLLVVVLILLGIYNFVFKKSTTSAIIQSTSPEKTLEDTQKEVPAKLEKIIAISDGPVLGAAMDQKNAKIKYYDINSGTAWQVDVDGKNKQQISNKKITELKNVLWSSDLSKVLTMTSKNEQNTFYEYDYQTKKDSILKNNLDNAIWDNLGTKIYYKYFDKNTHERTLNIANPDGSGWQKIADLESKNISIAAVPLSSLVSFWNSSDANEETKLQIVGSTGGEIKTVLNAKFGADYLWSPNGSKALVSALQEKNGKKITLGTVSIDGKYQDLNIPTFVTKCVWSKDNKTVYYTLPGEIPASAILPNDYQENKFTTADTFWRMDTTTGEKSRIIEITDIAKKYDASNMFLSVTEDTLYFINKIDQKLYRIEL